jgi:hypothetical protein
MTTKTLSVKLPAALDAKLAAAAARRRVSKSAVIRGALERALADAGGRRAGSFLALARDLHGCVTGPGDLSYHSRHLRGYGR